MTNSDAAAFQNWTFDSSLPWMQGKSSMCDKGERRKWLQLL